MKKLGLNHIKIKSPGKQVREVIIDKFGDIDNFANEIEMHSRTVKQYLKEARIGSDTFKIKLFNALDKGFHEIVKSEKDQVKEMVENIHENIQMYKEEEDISILERAKELCIKNNLHLDMLKMQRNIAMYYFYRNEIDKGIGVIQSAIDSVKVHKYLVKWKSELGLMNFYKCEYKESRKLFREVDKLLDEVKEIDDRTIYLHYYRYGMLQNSTKRHPSAEILFEKSLKYAQTSIDKGDAIMNIGVSFERRKKYRRAMEYYRKALDFFEEDLYKSLLFNNIAKVYKVLEEYDRALYYINLAFRCLNGENLSHMFVYYVTYVQILIRKGEVGEAIEKLMELIDKAEDNFIYKKSIIEGINIIREYVLQIKDIDILEDMEELIYKSIQNATSYSKEYIKELKSYINLNTIYRKYSDSETIINKVKC